MAGRIFSIFKIHQENLNVQPQIISHNEAQTYSTPVVELEPKEFGINIISLNIISAEATKSDTQTKTTFPQRAKVSSCRSLLAPPQRLPLPPPFLGRTTSLKTPHIRYLCK